MATQGETDMINALIEVLTDQQAGLDRAERTARLAYTTAKSAVESNARALAAVEEKAESNKEHAKSIFVRRKEDRAVVFRPQIPIAVVSMLLAQALASAERRSEDDEDMDEKEVFSTVKHLLREREAALESRKNALQVEFDAAKDHEAETRAAHIEAQTAAEAGRSKLRRLGGSGGGSKTFTFSLDTMQAAGAIVASRARAAGGTKRKRGQNRETRPKADYVPEYLREVNSQNSLIENLGSESTIAE
ncbi:hypothetical protein BKA62DRAFT_714083 [Auriculariales sp. MPI-PUGE-AT-0066]|nr:hypothetical protein BKA62DRAFT_714083 [Auriculariales sp. MPI-PUGE-AT-0066]